MRSRMPPGPRRSPILLVRLEDLVGKRVEQRFALGEALLRSRGKRGTVKIELANLFMPACELLLILIVLFKLREGKFAGSRLPIDFGLERVAAL